MKKFLLIAALAATAMLADSQLVSARGGRGGCGGHGGCGGYGGGCGMGYGGGCGMMMGGCGMGGCGMGYGGGMMMGGCGAGGCGFGGFGGYGMGGHVQAAVNEATIVVSLPEDATLTVDGEETASTSEQRVFISPSLEEGKEYEYTLQAQIVRDGKVQKATAKVTVRAGETSEVQLKLPAAGVAAQ